MAHVSVTIDSRKYRLACNEGEEARLEQLASMVDRKIAELRRTFGEIGDQRLVVMAALTIADNLTEAQDKIEAERERGRVARFPRRGGRGADGRARGAARSAGRPAFGRRRGLTSPPAPPSDCRPHLRHHFRGLDRRQRRPDRESP